MDLEFLMRTAWPFILDNHAHPINNKKIKSYIILQLDKNQQFCHRRLKIVLLKEKLVIYNFWGECKELKLTN